MPRLQTYITGSTYYHDTFENDFATWITQNPSFELKVVGYWHPYNIDPTASLSIKGTPPTYDYLKTWLMITTPTDESGRIYINGVEISSFAPFEDVVPSQLETNLSLQNHEPAGGAYFSFCELGMIDNANPLAWNYAYGQIGNQGWGNEIPVQVVVDGYSWVHFDAVVVSPVFAGKHTLQRHRLIYAALGNRIGGEIHALSIEAYTPEEWSARQP